MALSRSQQWPCCAAPAWAGVSFPLPQQDFLQLGGVAQRPRAANVGPPVWDCHPFQTGTGLEGTVCRSSALVQHHLHARSLSGPRGAGQGRLIRDVSEPRAGSLTPASSLLVWIYVPSADGSSRMPAGLSCLGQPDPRQ